MKVQITSLSLTLILICFLCNNVLANWVEKEKKISQNSDIKSLSDNSEVNYFKSNINSLKDKEGKDIVTSLSTNDSVIFYRGDNNERFGISVSSAGDVNGDGYNDVIIGADLYNSFQGKAFIYFGGPTMNNYADLILYGETNLNQFGSSVSTAGDVNGDGYSDVIVGAFIASGYSGKAYIYYGGASMDGIADVIMTGSPGSSYLGQSVSTAGDVNNDGFSDVIIGSPGYKSTPYVSPEGRADIYFGGVKMDNISDVHMIGEGPNQGFGSSVSTAGDVNGDGFSDVIIGAQNWLNSYDYKGRAYIYYGGIAMDTIADAIITGENNGVHLGNSVSTAGDVNGDGFSDVIIGAESYGNDKGRTYIFFGGINMDTLVDLKMTGESTTNYFGGSVSSAEDINGDGFDDIIVGARGYSSYKGRVYIYYGGINMDTIPDIIKTGETNNYEFGCSVSVTGDVIGNQSTSVLIGEKNYYSYSGRAILYINLVPILHLATPLNNSINNSINVNFKWKNLINSEYYILNIATDSLFINTIVKDTIAIDTFKIINSLQRETKYFWKVTSKFTSGEIYNSAVWKFKTENPITLNLKVLMEGMYYPVFNQMTRSDTVKVYLRNSVFPYSIVDSSKGKIDSISLTNIFKFNNTPNGTYYLVVKHFNSIETWSKSGGETLLSGGSIYNYDFSTAFSKAYGNNLKKKGSKYCMFSGDVTQDGIIDAGDISGVENDVSNSVIGHVASDLNGDDFVDADDLSLVENNIGVGVVSP